MDNDMFDSDEAIAAAVLIIDYGYFILLEDFSLYNKQKIHGCLKIPDLLLVLNT